MSRLQPASIQACSRICVWCAALLGCSALTGCSQDWAPEASAKEMAVRPKLRPRPQPSRPAPTPNTVPSEANTEPSLTPPAAAGAQPSPAPTRIRSTLVGAPGSEPRPAQAQPPAFETIQAAQAVTADAAPPKAVASDVPPIFVGWPAPKAAFVLSGETDGYIEPCGCAGLENMKGGLGRRHDLVNQLRAKGWPVASLDVGGQVKRTGHQQEAKFRATLGGLWKLEYLAVGFGAKDLRLPAGDLASLATEKQSSFVSANVGLFAIDADLTPKYRVTKVGAVRVGVTAIVGDSLQKKVDNSEIAFAPAAKALEAIVPKLKQEADYLILLAHATPAESAALAKQFPDFQLVVTAGGADEPPAQPGLIEGTKTPLIEVGHKGMFVSVLGLFDDPQQPWRYQRVPLDKRFKVTPEMKQVMADYQQHLKVLGFKQLGLKPTEHPSGRKFVGSAACNECHTKAAAVWENTPHAHALDTLVHLDPPRHFDPECLSCHVVGWRPQAFDAYTSGYVSLEKTAQLQHVGCENCHGPGSAHVAAENGEGKPSDADLKKLREQMVLKLENAERTCLECHDLDNSPSFDFKTFWPKVDHKGKD